MQVTFKVEAVLLVKVREEKVTSAAGLRSTIFIGLGACGVLKVGVYQYQYQKSSNYYITYPITLYDEGTQLG